MRSTRKNQWILAASIAVMPIVNAHRAQAQFAAGQNGHALDANQRQGSGGYNDAVSNSANVTGNDIVLGNVTGGRQFRGNLNYGDPFQFRSNLPGRGLDAFIRDSSGVPAAYSPQFSLSEPRAFYGTSGRGVNAPLGTAREGFTGAYVGTGLTPANPYQTQATSNDLATQRLGSTDIVGVPSAAIPNGLVSLPGSIDSSSPNIQTALGGSLLYGNRVTQGYLSDNSETVTNYLANGEPGQLAPTSIDQNTVDRLRRELQSASIASGNSESMSQKDELNQTDQNGNPLTPGSPGAPAPGSLNGGPLNSSTSGPGGINGRLSRRLPTNQPLSARPFDPNAQNNGATPGADEQGAQGLVPPARQSTQYNALAQRLEAYNNARPGLTVTRQRAPAKNSNSKGFTGGATTQPSGREPGARPPITPAGAMAAAEPVKIKSLADGVQAKGLHDLLAAAEDLMRQDKFKSAIEQYDAALRVAPNNSLIQLGKVNAELAAGYYSQAEAELRRTLRSDPALLMGQIDLKGMLSKERLDYLKKDLKDLADKDPKAGRPPLLLAYLDYNTEDSSGASANLQEAKKRIGSADPVIRLMERYWSLPSSSSGNEAKPELNK